MSDLTHRQRSIYEFIVRQVRRNGIPPTLMEIAEAFGLSSPAGISDHLKAIERKGYIRRRPGTSRGIEIARHQGLPNPARRSVAVPIVGEVPSAGGLDRNGGGSVFLDSRLGTGRLFAVRAREAMPERGILVGDLLVAAESSHGAGLAVGCQGRRVLLLEVASDGRTARPLHPLLRARNDVELRGRVVAIVRCFDDLPA